MRHGRGEQAARAAKARVVKKIAQILAVGLLAILGGVAFLILSPERRPPPASLDTLRWVPHTDPDADWSVRYPREWHLQIDDGSCPFQHEQILVTNVGHDLQHPEIGGGGCTDQWDMRELSPGFVVLELETPADVAHGREKVALSLKEARISSPVPEFGVPARVWIPVWIDRQHQYLVRLWLGPIATQHDQKVVQQVVSSIRFQL